MIVYGYPTNISEGTKDFTGMRKTGGLMIG